MTLDDDADGRLPEVIAALERAFTEEPDIVTARDLALVYRDLAADDDAARDACDRGLALPAVMPDDDLEEGRVARHELATLRLRLCGRSEAFGLYATLTAQMPLVDRLLVRAFARSRYDDHLASIQAFHDALSREPYHPTGNYDLACVLAAAGASTLAREVLSTAIHDGQARLADRYRHDPELDAIRQPEPYKRPWAGCHALNAFAVRPAFDPYRIAFPVRSECRQAAYDLNIDLSFADTNGAVSGRPDFRFTDEVPDEFVLYMSADKQNFPGFALHCALRRVAALVDDVHGFAFNWNAGGYLDEIRVVSGQLQFHRWYAGEYGEGAFWELLAERAALAGDDDLLTTGIARYLRQE